MHTLAKLDHRNIWHPFTQMRDWLKREPIVIVSGKGAVLRDQYGRKYLDGNSSIWTNLHGHRHPSIDKALRAQLRKIAHSSALGLANEPASLLAEELVLAVSPRGLPADAVSGRLNKVFFSDDGATAIEVALKLAYEYARRTARSRRPRFLSLQGAYHGDTVGAVSLGHIDLFHSAYAGLLFKSDKVMAPYCYRCPFNRARPERADARAYCKCHRECVGKVEQRFQARRRRGDNYAAMVFEPLIQGAAGMIAQPSWWLAEVAQVVRANGALLIADEVLTGFGRTNVGPVSSQSSPPLRVRAGRNTRLFACQEAGIQPDLMALAKGLTGGYLPMAATLATQPIFDVFLGEYRESKTFFHGHSYTANQLGAAAALASLKLLQSPASLRARQRLADTLSALLETLWRHPNVGDIRQVGLIAGVELVEEWKTRAAFDARVGAGARVCEEMARQGVLTRAIGNVVVLMPPYCTTDAEAERMVQALNNAIGVVFLGGRGARKK